MQRDVYENLTKRSNTAIVHDNPQLRPIQIRSMVFDDIRRRTMAKNRHLSFDLLDPFIVLLQVHHFYGNKRSRILVQASPI